ncbi:MAG TPA: condensation domain-containing protein [Pyrinomonadaceae bacterium]|nr:condensation domain-containing protein [Pyrinomonadaceae bacterium]
MSSNQLSGAKRALLEKRLGRTFSDLGMISHIPRRPLTERAPLSIQQHRQWLLLEKERQPSFYNNIVRLKGSLDALAFCRAFDEVVNRHEIMRTTLVVENGQPVQVIHPPRESNLPFKDLSGLATDAREQYLAQLSAEQVRPFDLAQGPLFRATLLRFAEEEHVLLFTLLHLVADYWSIKVMISEISTIYRALIEGKAASLPELPIQYGDYAWWQQQPSEQARLNEELEYWRPRLQDYSGVLQLPTDKPRPPLQTFCGAHESIVLSQELSEALQSLSRREGGTLFMTMLAVLNVLLSFLTGSKDIGVATGVAGRHRVETERLVGCFINTLVMRTNLEGDPSFTGLLRRVREVALGAFAHQEMPFQKLAEDVVPFPNPSYPPLVQVSFALHHQGREADSDGDLRMSMSGVDAGRAAFDLTLRIHETGYGIVCSMEYNTDLFEPATITRMLENYRHLSEQVAADAQRRLSQLNLKEFIS